MATRPTGNLLLDVSSLSLASGASEKPTITLLFCHSVASQLSWTADQDYFVRGVTSSAANYVISLAAGLTIAVVNAYQKAILGGVVVYRADAGTAGLNYLIKKGETLYCETSAAQRVNVFLCTVL